MKSSRRGSRSVADRVADGYLRDDVQRALDGMGETGTDVPGWSKAMIERHYLLHQSLDDIGHEMGFPPKWVAYYIEIGLRQLRTVSVRNALADYHFSAPPSEYRLCAGCFKELEPRPKGRRGPRTKHCGATCRQRAHRRMKKASRA